MLLSAAGSIKVFLFLALLFLKRAATIGCFVCSSINGSDSLCEDPFQGNQFLYRDQCMGGRKGRDGLFPADSCIKFKASNDTFSIMVRDCSVDNGEITSDTEMGRESHCWMVNMVSFDDVIMAGCSLSCRTDGCNSANPLECSICNRNFAIIYSLLIIFSWFQLMRENR